MTRPRIFALLLLSAALAAPALAMPALPMHSPFGPFHAPPVGPHVSHPAPPDSGTYTVIDAPDAGTQSGQGTAVYGTNSSGTMAGDYEDSFANFYGFLRTPDGTFTEFAVDGGQTIAYGISDNGAVSGTYLDPNTNTWRGFLRTPTGKYQTFDPGDDNGTGIFDQGVNKSLTIVGDYTGTDGYYHSFFRLKDGALTEFDAPGGYDTDTWGINKGGTMSGNYAANGSYHGFLRAPDGTFTEFDAPGAAGPGTIADRINNKGWASGDYGDSIGAFHAFIRDPSGNFTEYDAPDAGKGNKQGTGGEGGINRHETVAAAYVDSSNVPHGYIRAKSGTLTEFDPPGSTYTETWDLNDSDNVVGDYIDSSGVYHGYLRTP
ncbi:MAG TPA: hypothetical protein VNX86_00930 [Rhizomicrobium sp.]|nr:hypothetical protein [Rhizomicrobium sp.]